jgi:cathepsin B
MSKFVLLTIFLIASAFASHEIGFRPHFGRTQHLAVGDKADTLNFFKGFLKGVGSTEVFDNIKECISDSKSIINNLAQGVKDIETKNLAKVQEGIALIGKACEALPAAVQQCKAGGADVATLLKLIKTFKSPASFIYYVGKSLLINRVEVYGEINHALAAYHSHDFETFGYWVGKAMDTIFLGDNAAVSTVDSKEEVVAFTKGFLAGIAADSVFDELKACISESKTFFTQISTAIADIRSKDAARVKDGIILLGQAVQLIPQAARDCQAAQYEVAKLVKLATAFTNPQSFIYFVGKSLLINHIEVIHEVTNAVDAFEHKDYYNLGYWVGKAMDTIFLGFDQPLRQGLVDFLNNNQNSWTAELPSKFEGMTLAEIKNQYLGAIVEDYSEFDHYVPSTNDIPVNFNSSEQWPGCIHPIRDQGHCGSCWAFAASEVLSDRFCIASSKAVNVVLSPQYMVSCNSLNHGCNGGIPYLSWTFLVSTGLVTDSCWPYQSSSGQAPKCKEFTKCYDGQAVKYYKAKKGSIQTLANPKSIQEAILAHGPVEAGFQVYEDFMNYKGGIYKHTSGSLLGGHAVKIIGWGREDNTDYWLVANSWNTTWGINGFFKIAFGQCGIDKGVVAGQAEVSSAVPTFFD